MDYFCNKLPFFSKKRLLIIGGTLLVLALVTRGAVLHLLCSLLLLGVIIALTATYLLVGLYCAIWLIAFIRSNTRFVPMKVTRQQIRQRLARPKVRSTFILFILVSHLTLYTTQYATWALGDNAHWKAKQYWVAGQVLNGVRRVMTLVVHPQIPVMYPADLLQKLIYRWGTHYLPDNDAEIAVWQNTWFHYHYTFKTRRALISPSHKPSPETVKLLDQWWFCLETMATKPFADHQMEVEHYYRDFPALAFNYTLHKGFYSGKKVASNQRMAQLPEHVERSRLLVRWLTELKEKWQSAPSSRTLINTHPKIELLRQATLLLELPDLIQGEICAGRFNCDNPSVRQYLAVRQEFTDPPDGRAVYHRLGRQGQYLYEAVIEGTAARSTKYVIKHFCGQIAAGKEDNRSYESQATYRGRTVEQQVEHEMKANYWKEIKILEEQMEGNDE